MRLFNAIFFSIFDICTDGQIDRQTDRWIDGQEIRKIHGNDIKTTKNLQSIAKKFDKMKIKKRKKLKLLKNFSNGKSRCTGRKTSKVF